jgi:hypothetical protein
MQALSGAAPAAPIGERLSVQERKAKQPRMNIRAPCEHDDFPITLSCAVFQVAVSFGTEKARAFFSGCRFALA